MTRTKLRTAIRVEAIKECVAEIEAMRAHHDSTRDFSINGTAISAALAGVQARLAWMANKEREEGKRT
jgi:hypothetical protein